MTALPSRAPRPVPAHVPVMLREVVAALSPRDGGVYVDGTFGGGGYSGAILEAAHCTVWGIDRDPDAIAAGGPLAARYGGRLHLVLGRFGEMDKLLSARGVGQVNGVTFDLGASALQFDTAERGFSFRLDGPLDMRMEKTGRSAADVVNSLPEGELAGLLFRYGEERFARRIARAIVEARARRPITRTLELAEIVRAAVPRGREAIDPATRTFQALRIYVNDELGELDRGLAAAERILAPGGRLAVVSFHSLEDRRVKQFLAARARPEPRPSRHSPEALRGARRAAPASFRLLFRRAVRPSAAELRDNPRARSARLRAAERLAAPSPRGAA